MIARYADELYVVIGTIDDAELDPHTLAEFLELLILFFKLAVSLMLLVFELIQAGREAWEAIEMYVMVTWRMGVVWMRAFAYGAGVSI